MHLHLNLAGGLTADMFIAAVLDAFPRFEGRVMAAIDALDAAFPEVGAWDAIAEIVGAATLIDGLSAARWTAAPLRGGEIVTQTGAAILSYLCPPTSAHHTLPQVWKLAGSGTGFGSRRSSVNSHLRVLWFDEDAMIGHRDPARAASFPAERLGQQSAQ